MKFILRTDLSTSMAPGLSQYLVPTGIMVAFNLDDGKASIQQIDATDPNPTFLAITPYNFSVGTPYSFTVTDDGTDIGVAIDGQNILDGTSSFSTGDLIAFQSREFSYTSSSIDYLSIQSVPEPSTYVVAILAGVCLISFQRKRSSESQAC